VSAFRFSPGHCGTGDCGCGGPCPACAIPSGAPLALLYSSFTVGSGTIALASLGDCVWEGCGALGPSISLWGRLDLSGATPLAIVRYYSASPSCSGAFSECRSDVAGPPNGLFLTSQSCPPPAGAGEIHYSPRKTTAPTATWCNSLNALGFTEFTFSQ
jgi:hypothetical protein